MWERGKGAGPAAAPTTHLGAGRQALWELVRIVQAHIGGVGAVRVLKELREEKQWESKGGVRETRGWGENSSLGSGWGRGDWAGGEGEPKRKVHSSPPSPARGYPQ